MNGRAPTIVAVATGTIAALACNGDPSAASGSAWASAPPSISAPETPDPAPPAYRVAHSFPKETAFFAVGSSIMACARRCTRPVAEAAPEVWVVTGDQSTKRAGLLPDEPSGRYYRAEYSGTYPATLEIFIALGREEPAVEKVYGLNASGARPVLRLKAERQSHGLYRKFREQRLTDPADIAAYNLYFDQEMVANARRAYTPGPPIGGYGGPLLAVEFDAIARWDPVQRQWSKTDAPWHQPLSTARLTNGASLVFARRTNEDQSVELLELYWVSTAGKMHPISIPAGGMLSGVLEVGNEVWLDVQNADGALLLAPARPEELTLP